MGWKRHSGCRERYIEADKIEVAVEELYKKMKMSPAWQKKLRSLLEEEIVARSASSLKERKRLTAKVDDLTGKRCHGLESNSRCYIFT